MMMWVDIEQVPSDGECIDLTKKNNAVELIEQECADNDHYLHTDQYRNELNTEIHETQTGPEIYADLPTIDYFFGSLGTTGSSGWVTKFLKSQKEDLTSVWVVSDADDFIPGIRNREEMKEVGIFDRSLYDEVVQVSALDAIDKMRKLIHHVGMMCGPTTWAVYAWLLQHFRDHPIQEWKEKTWVLIACDRVEPYLSYIKQRLPEIFHKKHKHCILRITPQDQAKHAQSVSLEDLDQMMDEDASELLLFDVRSNKSFVLWHVPGSINIPLDMLTDLTDKWSIFDKDKKIILLCPLGKQTNKLCAYLNMSWFDAHSLEWWLRERKKKHRP